MLHRVISVALVVPAFVGVAAATAGTAPPRCHGLVATIVGTPADDDLVGTAGPDVVVGRGGNDRIDGRGGDDVICGGPGSDELLGGRGDDRLYGGRDAVEHRGRAVVVTGDLLEGGPGDDLLDTRPTAHYATLRMASDRISYLHSRHGVRVDLARGSAFGEGHDTILRADGLEIDGSRHDDVLLGSARDETFDGGRGDDRMDGRGGRDAVLGYHGDDDLRGGSGRDLVVGIVGTSTLRGGPGFDFMAGGSERPMTVLGGGDFDYIERSFWGGPVGVIDGGPGDNQLEISPNVFDDEGVGAIGTVDRAAGTASLAWGDQSRQIDFDHITSFILWGGERWTFRGTDDSDYVQVLDARLNAETFGGDDVVFGGDRNDTIDAGDGTDTVWGSGGHNTCLNAEKGDCDGDPSYAGARVATSSPSALQSWLSTGRPILLAQRELSVLRHLTAR